MTADSVPLRRVLLSAGPSVDLSAAVDLWRRQEPALLLSTGLTLPAPGGPVTVISCYPTPAGRLHRDTQLLSGPPLPPPPPLPPGGRGDGGSACGWIRGSSSGPRSAAAAAAGVRLSLGSAATADGTTSAIRGQ